jgi:hypothetical protein
MFHSIDLKLLRNNSYITATEHSYHFFGVSPHTKKQSAIILFCCCNSVVLSVQPNPPEVRRLQSFEPAEGRPANFMDCVEVKHNL